MKTAALGQVATPWPIAEFMTRWACAERPRRILDPSYGGGVFVDCVEALPKLRGARVIACEKDGGLIDGSRKRRGLDFELRHCDFLTTRFDHLFDAIICNPPYVRHHTHKYPRDVLARLERAAGVRLSRLTNLYGWFLLRNALLLSEQGRAAVITPAEWLNADFGGPLKEFLLARNLLDSIIHFGHETAAFDGVLTTAAIVLLRRGRAEGEAIRLRPATATDDLEDETSGRLVIPRELDATTKWSPLFATRATRRGERLTSLGEFFRCVRGVATGANDYFVLRPSEVRAARIDLADVRPCVAKAAHVQNERFTRADLQRLVARDERVYLLDPRQPLSATVRRYLDKGKQRGIHERYLPSHRPVWYRPEQRAPAPLWVNTFARGGFRFVRNEAAVLHLTAFHSLYPRERCDVDAMHGVLNSRGMQARIAEQMRIYAAGLCKLEPRDVERIGLPASAASALRKPRRT